MAALFLKAPLQYQRISSKFSLHRMDPIRHIIAPHLGVDYAAPIGTPIHSIGDGTLVFRGWSHGFGRTVIIKYKDHYQGLYAHMSQFAQNIPHYIKKGAVIGYVGQSGWATGPHLHFGLFLNGKAIDPLAASIPKEHPLTDASLIAFNATREQLLTTFTSLETQTLALHQQDDHHES